MILVLLAACGVSGDPLTAAPSPTPPPELARLDTQAISVTGVVADVSAATRSWTVVGDGRRYYCVLANDGRLLEGSADIATDGLLSGAQIMMEGRLDGDVLLVKKGSVPAPAAGVPEAGVVDPAAEVAVPAPTDVVVPTAPAEAAVPTPVPPVAPPAGAPPVATPPAAP